MGLLQNGLEFMHVTCGLPWWGAIMAGKFGYLIYILINILFLSTIDVEKQKCNCYNSYISF